MSPGWNRHVLGRVLANTIGWTSVAIFTLDHIASVGVVEGRSMQVNAFHFFMVTYSNIMISCISMAFRIATIGALNYCLLQFISNQFLIYAYSLKMM
jgi:hypothetical protein